LFLYVSNFVFYVLNRRVSNSNIIGIVSIA